jgi:DNA primase
MKFPPQLLDDIRARLPVSQVVGRKVALKKAGREWKGLSPFKTEKSPSFYVNDQKGFYHCFASGEHGDIFKFVMTTEGLTFPEAVERLAAEAGVPMPKFEPRSREQAERYEEEQDERTRLYALLQASQAFFVAQLHGSNGHVARRYVEEKRGLSRDTIEAFGIGYAPSSRTALKEHLAGLGFKVDEMVLSGMLAGGDDIPNPYDRFRQRVMFPIADTKGRVIAFGGRALQADVPAKYLNSPETPLFHKGHVLYNAAKARPLAHTKSRILVVEGYMDVVALTEGGFGEAVAPLGTALTQDQVQLLWRMADEPILCFDGDSAGKKAAYRAIDTVMPFLKPGISLRFAFLPDGLDPDDLIRQNGPAAMEACLSQTRSLIDVMWDREWASGDWTTPERRAQLELQLNTLIARIEHESVRLLYQKEIRNRLYEAWGAKRREQQRSGPHKVMPGQKWGQGGRGGFKPGFNPSGARGGFPFGLPTRQPASDSLRQSRLGTGHPVGPPQREALLMLALINHPWLIEAQCEEIAALELTHRPFGPLKTALLDIATQNTGENMGESENSAAGSLDATAIRTHLREVGLDSVADQAIRAVTHTGDRFAAVGTDPAVVSTGFQHALGIQRRQVALARDLDRAQLAWQADQSEENAARIAEIKAQQGVRVDIDAA